MPSALESVRWNRLRTELVASASGAVRVFAVVGKFLFLLRFC